MESRDFSFCVVEYETYSTYYAQTKDRLLNGDQILQSDLTQAEAMALLSLIGEPTGCTECYFVCVEK
jgi:hypothetical protein